MELIISYGKYQKDDLRANWQELWIWTGTTRFYKVNNCSISLEDNTCEQYRKLSFMFHASKIITRIVLEWTEKTIEGLLTEHQFWLKREVITREVILALRQVIEIKNRKSKSKFIAFVDLQKKPLIMSSGKICSKYWKNLILHSIIEI